MSLQSQIARPDATADAGLGRRRWWSLVALCLGVMMAFVNITATLSAISAIQDDLHTSASQLVWISSIYSLVVVSLVMSAGTMGDLVGRRLVFLAGAAVLAASSGLAFFADSNPLLITAEGLMGVGGAALLPTSLSIISHTFPDPHERTSAISAWAACSGLGLAVGPLVAGVLMSHFSWHSVFLSNVVLGVAALILVFLLTPESRHPSRRLDAVGVVLGTTAIASGTYAIIEGGAIGYTAGRIITMYVICAAALALFVVTELRHHDPMLDLRLFKNASFGAVMAVTTTTMFGFVGTALLCVLYIERVQRQSPLATGVRMLPLFLAFILTSAVAGRLVRRTGFVVLLTTGLLIAGAGTLILLSAGPFTGYGRMWPGMVIVGVGTGLLMAPLTAAAVNSVAHTQAGMAGATVNMFRQLGAALGPAVLGTILTTGFAHNLLGRLQQAHVPAAASQQIVDGAGHGASTAILLPDLRPIVADDVPRAFTDAMHHGLLVAGIVLLVMAIPTMLLVRHRAEKQ